MAHKCFRNCTGLSFEFCTRKYDAICKHCEGSIKYGELAAYAHVYRAHICQQSGWHHLNCLKSVPTIAGRQKDKCRFTLNTTDT